MPMLIGFGAGVLVVGYIVGKVGLHALAYAKKDLKGGVSFVTFIQIVSLLGQFKFEWPEGLKAFFGWFSVFKLNVAVARPECTTSLASLRSSPASDRRPSGVSLSYRNSRIRLA